MNRLRQFIRSVVSATDVELDGFLSHCTLATFPRRAYLSRSGDHVDAVYYIHTGLVRMILVDGKGTEHTHYFAYEDRIFGEYSSFLQGTAAVSDLQALEKTEVVVIPRVAIEWAYANMAQGDRLGRLVAESYFVYKDVRLQGMLALPPKVRYEQLTRVFPDVHARVPQHMIASYLGITPEYLSRLKKAALGKG
ncbi:MAG: Crp/Fnr family transcriptional regulator [Flavobacteriales bacterium]